jgi:hypothetical protein
MQIIIVLNGVLLGVVATALFDGWLWLQKQLGGRALNFAYLGRWIGHFTQMKFVHANIAKSPALTHEWGIGVAGHYVIGIMIAELLLLAYGDQWLRAPDIVAALVVGMLTVVLPLLIMQPGMGGGIVFLKTPQPIRNCLRSLFNHSMFGVCMFLAADLLNLLP